MASIDKIYGTIEQYDEFHSWCAANKPDALRFFYQRDGYVTDQRPITNFPEAVDMWLLDNCHIDWVVGRIKAQYGIDTED